MHSQAQSLTAPTAGQHHPHPNYVAIWAILLVLLGISLALGHIPNPALSGTLIFGIAAIKIGLVMRYFMHMKFEPWLLAVMMVAALLCVLAFFIGVVPDLAWRNGWSGR